MDTQGLTPINKDTLLAHSTQEIMKVGSGQEVSMSVTLSESVRTSSTQNGIFLKVWSGQ